MVFNFTIAVVFALIMPASVLVINVVVAIQVRRAAIHAAANLGVQPHHQSTSAVPTIMLITTSLIYVLFQATKGIIFVLRWWALFSGMSNFSTKTVIIVDICFFVVSIVCRLIYVYNFYVYLITGKQFRSDLHKLLCRCFSSSSSSSSRAPAPAHAHALVARAPVVVAADDDAEVARRVIPDTAVSNLLR